MRFEVVWRNAHGDVALIRDNVTGHVNRWIRGFTYKAWICAESGQVIKASGVDYKVWAWRIAEPKGVAQGNLRVTAKLIDDQFIWDP